MEMDVNSLRAVVAERDAEIERLKAEIQTLRNFLDGILHAATLALSGQKGSGGE